MTDTESRHRIDRLLAPATTADLASCFGERSCFIPGHASKVQAAGVDLAAFYTAITPALGRPRAAIKAQYFDRAGNHAEMPVPAGEPGLVRNLLAAGMTICVCDFDALDSGVGEAAAALAEALGAPAAFDVSCYVSGHDAGFGLHFDTVPVLVLQCEGAKRWQFGERPAVVDPGTNLVATDRDQVATYARRFGGQLHVPGEGELQERRLAPGDLLFLPAGTWHRTSAEGFSLALTFTLSPRRLDADLVSALCKHVEERMRWAPVTDRDGSGDGQSGQRARLEMLKRFVAEIDADDVLLRLDDRGTNPPRAAVAEGPPADAVPSSLTPETRLSAAPRTEVALFTTAGAGGARELFVCRGDEGIQLDAAFAPFVEALFGAGGFRAGDTVAWLDPPAARSWETARALLESLSSVRVVRAEQEARWPAGAAGTGGVAETIRGGR